MLAEKTAEIGALPNNMEVRKFLVASGNSTALVQNCPVSDRKEISKMFLNDVEQVGFISTTSALPTMTMMGGELCVNATLAFASMLEKDGKLKTSGLKDSVPYSNKNGTTTIRIPISFKKYGNIILLDGIGFVLYSAKENSKIEKRKLSTFSKKYGLPAFRGIIYDGNRITPYVYVKEVDSFVKETACGSGSIAFSIFSGLGEIVQPTGEKLRIKNKRRFFELSAKVTDMDKSVKIQ